MKILAFDDGFFPPHYKGCRGRTVLVGVTVTDSYTVESVSYSFVLVDGLSTTEHVINHAELHGEFDIVMLDGVTYAGFDVADPDLIHSELGKPVITVQQYPLDLDSVESALKKNFRDWSKRFEVIERITRKYRYLETPWKIIQYYASGLEPGDAESILRKLMIYSPIPEPLRIAHMIASAISRKLYEKTHL